MRLYLLQIHKDRIDGELDVFDELYHFEDFDSLCTEFQNKLNYYTNQGLKIKGIEEPTIDEYDNEASGDFEFSDSSGYRIMARVETLTFETK